MLKQLDKDYSDIIILEKPKHILENKLIKYNLSSGKFKRIEWGFLKIVSGVVHTRCYELKSFRVEY